MTARDLKRHMANRIEALREMHDLSQKQFATFCGVPQSTISEIERRLHVPSVMTLHKIASACRTNVSELLRGL